LKNFYSLIGLFCLLNFSSFISNAQEHPKLILTKAGVEQIRAELGKVPLFDASLQQMKDEVDAEIALGIDTPIPKDYSGGYTHTRHKKNWFILQKAGVLFQILEEEKYAIYVRDMLLQYAALYPTFWRKIYLDLLPIGYLKRIRSSTIEYIITVHGGMLL